MAQEVFKPLHQLDVRVSRQAAAKNEQQLRKDCEMAVQRIHRLRLDDQAAQRKTLTCRAEIHRVRSWVSFTRTYKCATEAFMWFCAGCTGGHLLLVLRTAHLQIASEFFYLHIDIMFTQELLRQAHSSASGSCFAARLILAHHGANQPLHWPVHETWHKISGDSVSLRGSDLQGQGNSHPDDEATSHNEQGKPESSNSSWESSASICHSVAPHAVLAGSMAQTVQVTCKHIDTHTHIKSCQSCAKEIADSSCGMCGNVERNVNVKGT